MKKKIITITSILILVIILTILWFSYDIIIYPDSTLYFNLSFIMKGLAKFSNWSITRGWGLPLFLLITGTQSNRFLLATLVIDVLMLILSYKIIEKFLKDRKVLSVIAYILFPILLVFNPIIIGYSHTVLTEAIAPFFAVASFYISYLLNIEIKKNSKRHIYIWLNIVFIYSWFLKQSYIIICLTPFILSSLFSIIKYPNKKNFFSKITKIFLSIFIIFISITVWNKFLEFKGVDIYNYEGNVDGFVSRGIVRGLNVHYIQEKNPCNIRTIEKYINTTEKNKLNQLRKKYGNYVCNYIEIYNITSLKGNIIDKKIYFLSNNKTKSTKDSLIFLLESIIEHPILVLDSYKSQYLATIDLYDFDAPDQTNYIPIKKFDDFIHENYDIAQVIYRGGPTVQYDVEQIDDLVAQNLSIYHHHNTPKKVSNFTKEWSKHFDFYQHTFQYLLLFSPFIFVASFVYFIYLVKKHSENKFKIFKTEIICILFGSAFIHVLFHACLNAIIDRYAYVAYPLVLLGFICLIIPDKPKEIKKKEKSILVKKPKVLFAIHAYNEEENIDKVLKKIKKDVNYADILVINNCSNDKTKEIVKGNGVKCINNIFKMKYVNTLQIVIKYAQENNYDYVVQFEPNEQDIVKEAETIYKEAIKNNYDIVINSRYLAKKDCKDSILKKLETKILKILIKFKFQEKITNPLSRFQCLNKRVIKKYYQMRKYPELSDAILLIQMLKEGYYVKEK